MSFLETKLERKYLNLFIRFLLKRRIYNDYLDYFKDGKIGVHGITSPQRLIGAMKISDDCKWFDYYNEWLHELSKFNDNRYGKE